MRIRNIETQTVDYPLRQDRIVISHAGRHDRSRFLRVTLIEESGAAGYGEAATMALWSGETPETARHMIEEVFAPAVLGRTIDHPREVLADLDALAVGNSFAKSAIDTALWDLRAKARNVSVASLIADREPLTQLPTRASVGAYPPDKTLALARAFLENGVRTLKLKIGTGTPMDDVARVRLLRDELGDTVRLTVDANGAYPTAAKALQAIELLLPYGIDLVEQPTPRGRLAMLAEVKRSLGAPIMADEAIFTPDELAEALEFDAFDVLSIYPGKNGGFTHATDMAQTAARAGKRCAIGSNLETDLGQAATAQLCASLEAFAATQIPGDFQAALFYLESSVQPALKFESGHLHVPQGPGFGVEPVNSGQLSHA